MRTQPRFPIPRDTAQWLGRFIITMPYLGDEVDWYYSVLFQRVSVVNQVPTIPTFVPMTDPIAMRIKALYEDVRNDFNQRYEAMVVADTTLTPSRISDGLIEEILTQHVNKAFPSP